MIPDPNRLPRRLGAALLAAALSSLPVISAAQEAARSPTASGPASVLPDRAQPAPGPIEGPPEDAADALPETGALLGPVRAQLAAGEVGAARTACRLLLRQYPTHPEVLVQMADIDLLLKNGGPAEVMLDRAIANGMPREQVLTRLGEAYLQQGQPQRVLDTLEAPDANPALAARVLALKARAQVQLDHREAAARLLAQALQLDPGNLAVLTAQGYAAQLAGDTEAARAAYGRAIAAHADAHEALAVRAELDHEAGRIAEAEAGYTTALTIAPEQWLYRYKRALTRIDMGRTDAAQEDLDLVARAFPEFIGLPAARGALALARGEAEAALDLLEEYLTKAPEDRKAFGLAMQAAARTGDQVRLRTLAERLQRLAPGSPGPALVTAQSLLQSGDGPGALAALEPVKGLAESNPGVALLYVQALRAAQRVTGRDAQADRALADAIGRFPGDAGLALEDARRLAREGAAGDALAAVDRALAERPADPDTSALRARLLFDLGRLEEARTEAQALVDAAPALEAGYRLLAGIRLAKGERDGAREALVQALERAPGAADLAVTLAQLETESGNLEAGVARYAQALAADPNNTQAMAGLARWDRSGAGGADLLERMQAALARDPNNAGLRAELIAALLAQARLEDAARSADETPIGQAQGGPVALARARAVAYLDVGRPADALGLLQGLASGAPASGETDYLTARAYAALGDARARDAFLAGWRLDPQTPLAGAVLTQVLALLKNNRQRESLAREMERLHPGNRTLEVLQALLAADRGDRDGAATRWRAIHGKDPEAPQVFRSYLAAVLAAGRRDEARRASDTWLARHPDDWQTSLMLANDLAQQGRAAAAAPHYQRVLALQPSNIIALNNLALHLAKTDPAAARDHAERALSIYPNEVQVQDTVGTVRLAAGDAAGAVDILTRAHDGAPADPAIAWHLAQARAAAGQAEQARALLLGIVALKFDEQAQAKALLARLQAELE